MDAAALKGRTGKKMSPRMMMEYKATADRLVKQFGKGKVVAELRSADFAALGRALAEQYGPVRVGNEVQKVKTLFQWARQNDRMIADVPPHGTEFVKPGRDELRKHRAAQGPRLFTADEVRRLLGLPPWAPTADPQLTAMTWLGINCAFGNTDIGELPMSALDLDGGWVTFARGKTGIPHRARLWTETVAALRAALAVRPVPLDAKHAGCVFLTRFGRPWACDGTNGVGARFGKLLHKLGINGRTGLGFYSLRHTFRTRADGACDVNAVRTIMGHIDDAIDSVYTHRIDDHRLEAVAARVRSWLLSSPAPGEEGGAA